VVIVPEPSTVLLAACGLSAIRRPGAEPLGARVAD